jgi:hypothetical protein
MHEQLIAAETLRPVPSRYGRHVLASPSSTLIKHLGIKGLHKDGGNCSCRQLPSFNMEVVQEADEKVRVIAFTLTRCRAGPASICRNLAFIASVS